MNGSSKHPTYNATDSFVVPTPATIGTLVGIVGSRFAVADFVRLIVELELGVSTGMEDTVPEVGPINVGETDFPKPEFGPAAVRLPPELSPEKLGPPFDTHAVTLPPQLRPPGFEPIEVRKPPERDSL